MKKLITLLVVFALSLSCFAGCGKGNGGGGGQQDSLNYLDDGKTYSYRMGPSDLPTAWNYHTYESNASTYILDYSSDALYTFDYNEEGTGFQIVPSMASEYPVDVTSNYVGKYGIKAGEVDKAYSIKLKTNLKFDNGEPITAESFVESMKLLLNPEAANFRADNVYQSGSLKIQNAEEYVKQGSYAYANMISENYGDEEYVPAESFVVGEDGFYSYNGQDICFNIDDGGNWGSELSLYAAYGYLDVLVTDAEGNPVQETDEDGNPVVDEDGEPVYKTQLLPAYSALAEAAKGADEEGFIKMNAELIAHLSDCIAVLHGYSSAEERFEDDGAYTYLEWQEMSYYGKFYDEIEFSEVGFFAPAKDELVIVLKNPMDDNFYLRYELCTSFFLVYAPLYKECIDNSTGVYTNDYATSLSTYVGYGPYKLTSYVADNSIVLERNMHWHGYTEEEYVPGTYQTDRVVYTKVADDATRLEMFLKGELESYGLQAEDMADYLGSSYTYFNDSESTWYLAMNPDFETLKTYQEAAEPKTAGNEVNKTVLSIQEFRQALSFSIDREQFNATLNPTSGIAKALLSSMIVADPESGLSYRAMDEAKDAILEYWGLSDDWGEGKEFETRDEAIDSITGYDIAGAKELFTTAYNKAVEAGYISQAAIESGKWEVQIIIGTPSESNYYSKAYEYFEKNWTDAVKDTPFEGHLVFIKSQVLGATSFGSYLRNGSVDILHSVGFGGSMFDPYSMMDCFTGSLQYDPFTDKDDIMLDIELDGKVLRASLYDWVSEALMGNTITCSVIGADGEPTGEIVKISAGTSDPASRRVAILAAAETKVLTLSNIFPLMTDATASLKCMRVQYKTEEYILGVGRGGIQYYTYAMDDAQFKQYVTDQGGELNYKG